MGVGMSIGVCMDACVGHACMHEHVVDMAGSRGVGDVCHADPEVLTGQIAANKWIVMSLILGIVSTTYGKHVTYRLPSVAFIEGACAAHSRAVPVLLRFVQLLP